MGLWGLCIASLDAEFVCYMNADHMRRSSTPGNGGQAKASRKYKTGLCSSDAEIDYRRSGRSLGEGKGDFAWHD